eukprot:15357614-Ditylum_brightwellii.AAC.1
MKKEDTRKIHQSKAQKKKKITVCDVSRDYSSQVSISYPILHKESDKHQPYIKGGALDLIAQAIKNVVEEERNFIGEHFMPMWTPCYDKASTKPLVFPKKNSLVKPTKKWNGME